MAAPGVALLHPTMQARDTSEDDLDVELLRLVFHHVSYLGTTGSSCAQQVMLECVLWHVQQRPPSGAKQ